MDVGNLIVSLIFVIIGVIALGISASIKAVFQRKASGCAILGLGVVAATIGVIGAIYYFVPTNDITSFFLSVPPSKLVFAGKVVNKSSNKWVNNRLVVLFLEGKEVGRAISKTGNFVESGQGVHDGLYKIVTGNLYEVQLPALNAVISDTFKPSVVDGSYFAYNWQDPFYEGDVANIELPSKNVQYTIKVIEGDTSLLPSQILVTGTATLKNDNTIVIDLRDGSLVEQTNNNSNINIKDVRYNSGSETIEVGKFTIPIDNCWGSVRIDQKYSHTQTFIHEYNSESVIGGSIELPINAWFQVMLELETKYGFQNGQIDTKAIEYNLGAEPHTKVKYVIKTQEVWEFGSAEVEWINDKIEMPFRAKTNLIYSIESEEANCN